MDSQKKKKIKVVSFFEVGICIIVLIVSIMIKDVPTKPTYTYINSRIITHSWHDIYCTVLAIASFFIALTTFICVIIWIIEKIKNKEKVAGHIVFTTLRFISCSVALIISYMIVVGFRTNDDQPSYYEFSDNRHTIVIEEKSFLLYGEGTIYQISDDNDAVIIYSFSTDDGGRNNGHYEIDWHDDYAEITYNTFNINGDKCTDEIAFVN